MIVVDRIVGKLSDGETRRVERVPMGWEDRLRSRQRATTDHGTELGIGLPTGQAMHEGDVLHEDDERVVVVATVPEDVLVLRPGSSVEMGRVAFQVGNRHAPIQVKEDRILTPYDHVVEEYFRKMGVRCERAKEPFTHDFGAYHHHH